MENSLPEEGTSFPPQAGRGTGRPLDRISFRVVYLAIFAFIALYVSSVLVLEKGLQLYFGEALAQAVEVRSEDGPVIPQIRARVRLVKLSPWVRTGRVDLRVIVQGADGTAVYFEGAPAPPAPDRPDPLRDAAEASRLLPVHVSHFVTVPHNSLIANGVLVTYAALLLTALFLYNRTIERRQDAEMRGAVGARDAAAERATQIEDELSRVRGRLTELGTSEAEHAGEIQTLQAERLALRRKLDELARREEELMEQASSASELVSERETLEELLDEALRDLTDRDTEIETLQSRLKKAAKSEGKGGRSRELEQLARRMRTLYKNTEFDDKALRDILALRDGTMALKAEEAIKRLSDDAGNTAVRRKVGGLPPHLNIFELGFAGKGRIYYTHGKQQRFRILTVGAKNSQKPDLEYLSRL